MEEILAFKAALNKRKLMKNPISRLNESAQHCNAIINFKEVLKDDESDRFECIASWRKLSGVGIGKKKKLAKTEAAAKLIEVLESFGVDISNNDSNESKSEEKADQDKEESKLRINDIATLNDPAGVKIAWKECLKQLQDT